MPLFSPTPVLGILWVKNQEPTYLLMTDYWSSDPYSCTFHLPFSPCCSDPSVLRVHQLPGRCSIAVGAHLCSASWLSCPAVFCGGHLSLPSPHPPQAVTAQPLWAQFVSRLGRQACSTWASLKPHSGGHDWQRPLVYWSLSSPPLPAVFCAGVTIKSHWSRASVLTLCFATWPDAIALELLLLCRWGSSLAATLASVFPVVHPGAASGAP